MKKSFIVLLALVLIVGIAVGGTVAWLTASTTPVVNTFATSDVSVTLTESENLDLKMIPGWTIKKDPKATVTANSEDCYLFVKIEKSTNYSTYLEDYEVATGWTQLKNGSTNVEGVYYREVTSSTGNQDFVILKDNQVKVKTTVTKSDMDTARTTAPTLTFTAYASQMWKANKPATGGDTSSAKFDAYTAWTNAQPTSTTP